MYFNDVHIMVYLVLGVIGGILGQLVDWASIRLPECKKVFSKEIAIEYKKKFRPNYLLIVINAAIYVLLLYKFGIHQDLFGNLDLLKYLILSPMLLTVFLIDYRLQIIPNRLNLTIFEVRTCSYIYLWNF